MDFNLGEFGVDNIYTPFWALLITLLVVIALVSLTVVIISLTNKDGRPFRFETRDLTYAAVCIAIAFALSFLGVTLPYGGTITLVSTLPIMIYCYYFGFRKGIIICTVYMMLQFLQNPYIISPWSALFDYIIPYMSLCLVGIFCYKSRNATTEINTNFLLKHHTHFYIGATCYIILRYLSHVLSGILFFSEYKWRHWALVPYSLAYNSFIFVDFAIAITASIFLFMNRSFNSFMIKTINANQSIEQQN